MCLMHFIKDVKRFYIILCIVVLEQFPRNFLPIHVQVYLPHFFLISISKILIDIDINNDKQMEHMEMLKEKKKKLIVTSSV